MDEKVDLFPFYMLKVAGSHDLLTRVSTEANIFKPMEVDGPEPLIFPYVLEMQRKTAEFTAAYAPIIGYEGAKDKAEADSGRDKCWRSSHLFLKGMVGHPDAELATISQIILDLYRKYGDPTELERGEESAKLTNLIEDIEKISEADLKKVYFDAWLADLKAKQKAFEEAENYYVERRSAKVKGLVQETRKAAEKACQQLLEAVNVLVNIESDKTPYTTFISKVNVMFEQQRTLLALRSTLSDKKKAEEAEEGTTDPTD